MQKLCWDKRRKKFSYEFILITQKNLLLIKTQTRYIILMYALLIVLIILKKLLKKTMIIINVLRSLTVKIE